MTRLRALNPRTFVRPSFEVSLTLVLLAVLTSAARPAEPETLNLDVNGLQRQAILYPPSSPPKSGGSPLVFVFHGHGGRAQNIARTMHIQTIWPEAIVVYPDGLPTPTRIDPAGKHPGWQIAVGAQDDRDLKFVDAMLATINKRYPIDKHRIYATGFSNGGVFMYVLWAARPNIFAALAPCSGLPPNDEHVTVPKPVFIVSGEADPLVKIANQRAMIEELRKLNGTTSPGESLAGGALLYKSDRGTPVETLIHPRGHVLPKQAPQQIVAFFKAHEMRN
jgi:polyhydroxybutyrate depolymerase